MSNTRVTANTTHINKINNVTFIKTKRISEIKPSVRVSVLKLTTHYTIYV